MRYLVALALIAVTAPATASIKDFGSWVYYQVPAEGSEPPLFVVESEQPVRGVAVIYSCKRDIDAARENLLLLNPGFREMPQDKRFEVLFTFGGNQQRGYADATLTADAAHGTLDVTEGLSRVLRNMQQFGTFIVTQKDAAETPITEVAIPLQGFDAAYNEARAQCDPTLR
ncbi:MAG: hypothetical protein ACX94A_13980 [Algiphilus sp.]